MTTHTLTTVAQPEAVYGQPTERAVRKEIDHLNEDYRAFVEASPFIVLSSVGAGGTDASPKGDAPGFVRILDERTLAIPDRPGNNRIDNLRNIVEDGRVSVLFIVPGVGETLRVNGTATISADPALLASFAVQDKLPRTVILVKLQSVYFHCSKALVRSKLWERAQEARPALPSTGKMLQRLTGGAFDGDAYDRELPERLKTTLY
ncbi:pyridoxamine 5'-phosphate oxidase family protein [uncultured Ralstonia sp.]|jgi:PPOX class probable FMN-dependent enzyme|uniref:pyridoxamine 5'-phosphate oxidase family protein n=1 Tax=Ralstonia sp. TaxID=54061 RepID=UPI001EA8ACF2|nr:pyridoxamine 5'-phosphate oxidase family protein [uncultured Ralstonia sp.]UCF22116.1 MAG: pyridoxamine 5'-phosphate oxidase family protein [Ralstonia sp.]